MGNDALSNEILLDITGLLCAPIMPLIRALARTMRNPIMCCVKKHKWQVKVGPR